MKETQTAESQILNLDIPDSMFGMTRFNIWNSRSYIRTTFNTHEMQTEAGNKQILNLDIPDMLSGMTRFNIWNSR